MATIPRDPHRIERAEIAATRRRWITLAELVAIAGLIIAAIGTWTTWSDHRIELGRSERDRAIDAKVRGLVLLGGMAIDDGKKLVVSDDAHRLQQVVFRFPAQLDVASRTSMIDPAIDASWFATSVLQGSGGDRRSGRLPVLITSIFWNADQLASDSAIYDVIWESKARLLRSRRLVLRGSSFVSETARPRGWIGYGQASFADTERPALQVAPFHSGAATIEAAGRRINR